MRSALFVVCLTIPAVAKEEVNFLKAGLIAEKDALSSLSHELEVSAEKQHKDARLDSFREELQTMYTSLPKSAAGGLTHKAVRYALHRFFARRNGWFVRGLEPNNDTWHEVSHGAKASMKEWVPSYLQDILEEKLGQDGTNLDELAALAAALDDLIQQEARGRLEVSYAMHGWSTEQLQPEARVANILKTYFVGFLLGGEEFASTSGEDLRQQQERFIKDYANWMQVEEWAENISLAQMPTLKKHDDHGFAFEELARVVRAVGEQYYTFNDMECNELKATLQSLEAKKPGRVRLSSFYNKGMYTHWDFSEKPEYLRQLGALDESDPKHPHVIITNYLMARPNCLDASNLYTICCRNECEDMMGSLEKSIGSATAKPEDIVLLVSKLPSASVTKVPRELPESLLRLLDKITEQNDGVVPLHGRLFAQWMHHAYPLECPYPHEFGSVNPQSANEWIKETSQDNHRASVDERLEQVARDSCGIDPAGTPDCADETSEIPWTNTEELLTWQPQRKPVKRVAGSPCKVLLVVAGVVTVVFAMLAVLAAKEDDNGKGLKRRLRSVLALRQNPLAALFLLSLAAYVADLLNGFLFVCVLVFGCAAVVLDRMSSPTHSKHKKVCCEDACV